MKTAPLRPLETTWGDWLLGGGARASFAAPALPLEVEIGPGDDDFLLERALAHPDRNWLGIEYSRKRVRRYVRKVMARGDPLGNLRLIWRPAADLVRPFLSPDLVEAYHVYFPDPWPKKHHHRFRMLTPTLVGDLAASLRPDGEVHVCTDDAEYAHEILEVFRAVSVFSSRLPPPGLRVVETEELDTLFSRRWRAVGREIYALRLAKTGAVADGARRAGGG